MTGASGSGGGRRGLGRVPRVRTLVVAQPVAEGRGGGDRDEAGDGQEPAGRPLAALPGGEQPAEAGLLLQPTPPAAAGGGAVELPDGGGDLADLTPGGGVVRVYFQHAEVGPD